MRTMSAPSLRAIQSLLPFTFLVLLVLILNSSKVSNLSSLRLIQPSIRTPAPLSSIYNPPPLPLPPFTVPQVVRSFYNASNSSLHVYVSGIEISVGGRNLRSVACVVDATIFDAFLSSEDVIHCKTPHVKQGQIISVAVLRDDEMKRQERESKTLKTGVVVTIQSGDFYSVPSHFVYSPSKYPREDLRIVAHSQPAPTPEPDFKMTTVNEDSPDNRRWKFCLMTQIAPFSEYLPEWVLYHRRIGIDHVYIFDNGANQNISKLFPNRPDVEVINFPYHKAQRALVSWFFRVTRRRCEYVIHMDVDEFIMVPLGSAAEYSASAPLEDALSVAQRNGYGAIKFLWIMMRNNGYRLQPSGYLGELFTQRTASQTFENGKTMCRTDEVFESGLVHNCGLTKLRKRIPIFMRQPGSWNALRTPTKRGDIPYLVHFRYRSWEDMISKMNFGQGTANYKPRTAEKAKQMSLSNPPGSFMSVSRELKWTGFREHWRRVMKEGRKWEKNAKMAVNGRCVMVRVEKGRFGRSGVACR